MAKKEQDCFIFEGPTCGLDTIKQFELRPETHLALTIWIGLCCAKQCNLMSSQYKHDKQYTEIK